MRCETTGGPVIIAVLQAGPLPWSASSVLAACWGVGSDNKLTTRLSTGAWEDRLPLSLVPELGFVLERDVEDKTSVLCLSLPPSSD